MRENPSILSNSSWVFFSWSEDSQRGMREIFVLLQDSYLSFFPSLLSHLCLLASAAPEVPAQGCSTTRYKNLHFLSLCSLISLRQSKSSKVQRPLLQTPFSLLFLSSPQPRTAIWLHLKHFVSHHLSLGRDSRGLLPSVILSPAPPAQPWQGMGCPTEAGIAPWHPGQGSLPISSSYTCIYFIHF